MPDDGDYTAQLDQKFTHVRLVSLHTWTFDTVDDHQEFVRTLEHINLGTEGYHNGTLVYPLQAQPPSEADFKAALQRQETGALQPGDADLLVSYAVAMGYIALPHKTRQGGQTVSWYRGPFVPYEVNERASSDLPAAGSDSLAGYDPATGLFDVSFAAAWQLGQLLALQNRTVAETLHQWKRQVRENALTALESSAIDSKYQSGSRLARAIQHLKQFTGDEGEQV
jgi:hypothetical protein